jgi:hypothetical protein
MKKTLLAAKSKCKKCYNQNVLNIFWHIYSQCIHYYQQKGSRKKEKEKAAPKAA